MADNHAAFNVSNVEVRLARDSRKKISFIKLATKNNQSPNEIKQDLAAGQRHQEQMDPPLIINYDDHLIVSIEWNSSWNKRTSTDIIVDPLRDLHCMRDDQGIRSYRKEIRNIEIIVTGRQTSSVPASTSGRGVPENTEPSNGRLVPITAQILQLCRVFRVLIIGNTGVGKSTLILKVFGVQNVDVSESIRGGADIDQEFISPTNEYFVVHDSLGFEGGDVKNMDLVQAFISRRQSMPRQEDKVHVVWLCIEIPRSGGRLLEDGMEAFLKKRREMLKGVPVVVVLTKLDLLVNRLEMEEDDDEDSSVSIEQKTKEFLDQHCFALIREATGGDVPCIAVSTADGRSESLSELIKITKGAMVDHHVDEASVVTASIAQRVSVKDKIESSIAHVPFISPALLLSDVSRVRQPRQKEYVVLSYVQVKAHLMMMVEYWSTLMKSAIFQGRTMNECLQVIRQDILTIWNISDPDRCLLNNDVAGALLRTDNLGDNAPQNPPDTASLGQTITALVTALAAAGEPTTAIIAPIVGLGIWVVKQGYSTYTSSKEAARTLMAFIVDLMCIMQVMFILASDRPVTSTMTAQAVAAYEKHRVIVHDKVKAFGAGFAVLPGGRDLAFHEIEALIWQHSIGDHEVEELRRRVAAMLQPSAS